MSTDDLNSSLRHILGDHHPEYCHQCGKCSSGCPVANFFDFRPRRIVAMVQLGFIEELLESENIWNCAQCLKCKERCPREVAPYDIIQALQNLAFNHNRFFPKEYSIFINSILKEGAIKKPTRVRIRKNSSIENKTSRLFC